MDCIDCGRLWDNYVVRDAVWAQAGLRPKDFCCRQCLARRLNRPLQPDDFKGWVQERGLYFPDKWDSHWTPILSSNDPGEQPHDGGLLIATSGKGYFVYTGYSWFRQLPAGVPGAYRLFANLVSLRNAK